jgi:ribosomal-protein-alanine N-acetyltransferase
VIAPVPLPDPPLVDGELRLRPWTAGDAAALSAAWGDPEVARFTGVPADRSEAAARRWIEGDGARRAAGRSLDLVVDVDGQVAGEVGLVDRPGRPGVAEVGWWIGPAHRGRGLAARAVRLLAGWALGALELSALEAVCDPANPASAAVARRAGFTPDGAIWGFGGGPGPGTVSP